MRATALVRSALAAVPVIQFAPRDADEAWQVHAALAKAEARDPALRELDCWKAVRDTASAHFLAAFEALS